MHLTNSNPATPARALTGFGTSLSSAASNSDHTTTAIAIKKILSRVAVSEHVALVIAAHAGLLREVR